MTPEERDWIDQAISRDGMWEPPPHFIEQVAVQAFAIRPPHGQRAAQPAGVAGRMRILIAGVLNDVALRIQGSLWMLRQYRELLLH